MKRWIEFGDLNFFILTHSISAWEQTVRAAGLLYNWFMYWLFFLSTDYTQSSLPLSFFFVCRFCFLPVTFFFLPACYNIMISLWSLVVIRGTQKLLQYVALMQTISLGVQCENSTVLKQRKGLPWCGRVVSGTTKAMKYDPIWVTYPWVLRLIRC